MIGDKKTNVDWAGLPTDIIDTEDVEAQGKNYDVKLKKLNEQYQKQQQRKIENTIEKDLKKSQKKDEQKNEKDILLEHDFEKIDEQIKVNQQSHEQKNLWPSLAQKIEQNYMKKPLRTDENYKAKMEQYKNQQNDKKDKNYWDFFKDFSKDNILVQEFKQKDAPIYIPTNQDKNDPYFQKIFKNLDLTCLIQSEARYENNLTQFYENKLTEEKIIRQYQKTFVQNIENKDKKMFMINAQFYEFNDDTGKFELNVNKKILLDIQEESRYAGWWWCPQFFLLNQGAKFYYYKKFEDEKIKEFQLNEIDLSKIENQKKNKDENQNQFPLKKQYSICLPEDIDCKMTDLEYQFLVDATPGSNEKNIRLRQKDFLDKQFMLIQTYNEKKMILIYHLKNTSKPILRFEGSEFEYINFGFYTSFDDVYLTLTSQNLTYQIKFIHGDFDQTIQKKKDDQQQQEDQIPEKNEQKPQDKFKLEDVPNINVQKCNRRDYYFNLKNLYPISIQVSLEDDKEESFIQSFYITAHLFIDLIYPMQPCEKNDDKRDKVIKFIEKKFGIGNYQRLNHYFVSNQIDLSIRLPDVGLFLDQEFKIKKYPWYDNVIFTKDTIFLNDGSYEDFWIVTIKKQKKILSSIDLIKNEYKDSSNYSLLNKILNIFDWKTNRILNESNFNQGEENFASFYINKQRENVFTTHHSAYISDRYYYFQDNFLLINLEQNNQPHSDEFKLLKLFEKKNIDLEKQNKGNNDQKKEKQQILKLVKYHRSENCVIFFFFYKCNFRLSEGTIQDSDEFFGVHFFVFKSVDQLKQMILSDEPLIKEETVIYIPLEINNFIKEKYDSKDLLKYVGQNKQLGSSTYINFELVRDFGDPCQDWLPFYYQNWVQDNFFDSYICFFNVERLYEKRFYQDQNDKDDSINFKENLEIFKIDFYKGINEQSSQMENTVRNSVVTIQNQYAKMFQRCSNWQKNIFNNNNEEQYSAKFYVGEVLSDKENILNVELREYFVTIDKIKKSFVNKEQQFFEASNKLQQDFKGNINVIMSKLKPNIFSQSQLQQYLSINDFDSLTNNYVLVPKIKTNGDIDGCYLMLKKFISSGQILQITDKESIIQEHNPELFSELKQRLNEYVLIREIDEENKKFKATFLDGGRIHGLNLQILNSSYYNSKTDGQLNSKTFIEAICDKQKEKRPSFIVYDVLNIENKIQNTAKYHFMKGKIFFMNFRNVYLNPKNYEQNVTQLEIILNKECILKKYFDKSESTQQFFYNFKYLISASLPNIFDLLFEKHNNEQIQFFQPRFILQGQSLCGLAFKSSQVQFDVFTKALEYKLKDTETDQFLNNSIIYHQAMKNQGTLENIVPQSFIKGYNMNNLYGLMKDFLEYETIIQAALNNPQNNRLKEASFLIQFIQNAPDADGLNWYALMQDIPQILYSRKFNINQFFDVSSFEEKILFENPIENKDEAINICNFERSLNSPNLPQFGTESKNFNFLKDSNETFFNDEEIQNHIILSDNNKEKDKNLSKIQVQVIHSFIAFDPILIKIKIDRILGRKSDKNINTDYLDLFDEDPKNIKHMNDLILSNLIFRNIDTPQFLEQNTIQSMIEIQYKESKPFIKNLLIAYTLGFYLPYVYASFLINYNDGSEQRSDFEVKLIYALYILAFITQTVFMIFELAEMRYNGIKEYFSDSWNYFDSPQYFLFIGNSYLSLMQMNQTQFGYNKLLDQVLKIVILLMSTTRILQYIRYKDSFSFLVQMLTKVLIDLLPFLTIFMIFIFVFTMIIIIMEADISADDYEGIPRLVRIMIGTFRNSIGDISIIQYGKWGNDNSETQNQDFEGAQQYAQFIIWSFWFFNLFFMLIIMLNFLIAEVSQTYDKVKSQGLVSVYRQKAALNKLVFQIKQMFHQNKEFRVMTIEKPPENSESEEFQEFSTFSERIKRNTNEQINKLRININKINQQQIDQVLRIEKTTKNVEQTTKNVEQSTKNVEPVVKTLENKISSIETQMNEIQGQVKELLKNQKTEIETQKMVVGSILELMQKQIQNEDLDKQSEIDSQNQ